MDSLDYSPSFDAFRVLLRSAVREEIAGHTYIYTYIHNNDAIIFPLVTKLAGIVIFEVFKKHGALGGTRGSRHRGVYGYWGGALQSPIATRYDGSGLRKERGQNQGNCGRRRREELTREIGRHQVSQNEDYYVLKHV
ncbi:hypothetical protein AVEN_263986-1 [Araneus ventricosus]|uniref:Uncharacterized protein n=1 Tax=Araneus ventricosus TaxID=182803 RepID=A0A4Y2V8H9_ARAVE|nr:hypothetical protein AVEN_254478-1 [Araneus ventricosus]GBO20837.1 hypothetical protein AVEN_26934-1 [Araneus ventricosus]GBO20841.1 hypothetical protein AVEN_274385-1 [Araneus ventricosus]GBO20873.1 hypothetical protein AVEN_263986-1 [Araneus ventricosus]